jgi:hypothetical protein
MGKIGTLLEHLQDRRSRKVVFVSHCLLNEKIRYLGGTCTGGCVKGVVEQSLTANAGIMQMPCPEQLTWQLKKGVHLPVWLSLDLADDDAGVTITHTIRAGFNGLGRFLDPVW